MEVKKCVFFTLLLLPCLFITEPVSTAPLKTRSKFHSLSTRGLKTSLLCDACIVMAGTIRKMLELHTSESLIVKAVIEICEKFTKEDDHICETIVPEFKTEVLYVFDHTALSSREICGTILDDNCGTTYDPFNQTWSVSIPDGKPPIAPYRPPAASSPINRVLHVSDIHWDPLYTPGLQARCSEPLCCRPPLPKGEKGNTAGLWGAASCDLPLRTVINLMEQFNRTQDQFDWIYLTGDLPAHNDWNQTKDGQTYILNKVLSLFKEYLPTKPLFFSFGNHESAPVNSFPPSFITGDNSISWLYEAAANDLKEWINTPDAITTFKRGGYFSIDFKGYRIISLQTNYCNNENWWLLINDTDPSGMLQWFIDKLYDAERKGMKVHVLGHISPGVPDCMAVWSRNYQKIALRFENTIVGQFFGHTHLDRIQVLVDYDTDPRNPRPFGTMYLGPGATTYTLQNPGYRIYTIDGTYNGTSREILDHETYFLNMTDANLGNNPKWQFEYSAKSTYNMKDLSSESWLTLLKNFNTDQDLFLKYYHYMGKSFNMKAQCSDGCQSYTACSAIVTFSNVPNKCGIITSETVSQEEMALYESVNDHC